MEDIPIGIVILMGRFETNPQQDKRRGVSNNAPLITGSSSVV